MNDTTLEHLEELTNDDPTLGVERTPAYMRPKMLKTPTLRCTRCFQPIVPGDSVYGPSHPGDKTPWTHRSCR